MTKRKHSSTADDGDTNKFLENYFREKGMESNSICSGIEAINELADGAREQFKKARMESRRDGRSLSGSEKYERRLANNRNSAAASRVYREVQKKGFEYSLKETNQRAKKYAQELVEMRESVKRQDEENERLRLRILALESKLSNPGSPIEADTDDVNIDDIQALNEFPSMFGSSQSEQRAVIKYGGLLPPRNSQEANANDAKVEELIRKIEPDASSAGDVFAVGILGNTDESPQNLRFSMESQEKFGSQSLRFPLGSQDSVGKIQDVPTSVIQGKIHL